jgi:hypothetical protein
MHTECESLSACILAYCYCMACIHENIRKEVKKEKRICCKCEQHWCIEFHGPAGRGGTAKIMAVMLILMFLPLIAIPAFWFLPLGQAIPFYGVCILLSALMFLIMHRTMRRPVTTGVEFHYRKGSRGNFQVSFAQGNSLYGAH